MNPELAQALTDVPKFDRFPDVDALLADIERLAAEHPDAATIRRIGTSRLGEPLLALTVGHGAEHAIVFGGVHPNEPVGGLTALHLARTLLHDPGLADRLGYTWHIIACIDPDGMRLNEGWFAGPLTWDRYGRQFYRPAPDEQIEWTFPFAYKRSYFDRVLPETQALMRLIDDTRPRLLCSLHNGEYGGVFYYLSEAVPELYETLQEIPARLGLPLHTGEPEAPCVQRLAPAVFRTIQVQDEYDYLESISLDPVGLLAGDSSAAYGARHGALTLVSEVPYWAHPDADNDEPIPGHRYGDLLHRRADGVQQVHDLLSGVLAAVEPDLTVRSPFQRASRSFIPGLAGLAARLRAQGEAAEADRPPTVAERFGGEAVLAAVRMRFGGMLLRTLDGEIAIGRGTPVIRRHRAVLSDSYDKWAVEADSTAPETIPIGSLVAVQYGAILAAATHLRER